MVMYKIYIYTWVRGYNRKENSKKLYNFKFILFFGVQVLQLIPLKYAFSKM